jgi:putative transposase
MGKNPTTRGIYYRRHLPHLHIPDATYFITFRLKGSLPFEVLRRLREERRNKSGAVETRKETDPQKGLFGHKEGESFRRLDDLLDSGFTGPRWLGVHDVAAIVAEAIQYRDDRQYDLLAYCIMPNHVHLVIDLAGRPDWSTYSLVNLKWYTALKCNKRLRREGAFWQDESHDHVVRDGDELERILRYVVQNPVKAGLANHWKDWPFTFCRAGLIEA